MATKKSPLMSQYLEVKNRYRDGILFFQVGDFYETFYEDAAEVSRILNIALTTRDKNKENPIPLAGVPIHAADAYIAKLLKAGRKVVICDQIGEANQGKGIVQRRVTDVITPGTTLSVSTLHEKENNYIASLQHEDPMCGFAILDLSTGEFLAGEEELTVVEGMLGAYDVREMLIPEGLSLDQSFFASGNHCSVEPIPSFRFLEDEGAVTLSSHFGVDDFTCFGLEGKPLGVGAAGALLGYVKELRQSDLDHISSLRLLTSSESLFLDRETVRNLELFEPIRGDSPGTTLIEHIDRTKTSMGARELRQWLKHPSRDIAVVEKRLDGVGAFHEQQIPLRETRQKLSRYPDIERLLSRITTGKAGPRELLSMADAFSRLPDISAACREPGSELIEQSRRVIDSPPPVQDLVERSIETESPPHLRDGGVIRKGFDTELDALIRESEEGRQWIVSLQETERKRTGIQSLRVGYNKVFGYYIEISRAHDDKVPDDYSCKQTLVSSQRYVSRELKEREQAILTAESRRIELEREIFSRVCREISRHSQAVQETARAVATIDLLSSLADLALERKYHRPEINESDDLVIMEGRHPVVEVISGKNFIPNDCVIRPGDKQLHIITGPNMGGKSTYIRQAALISIMAHMGSFVPASRAVIGLMDRIFTRVGSSDNLAKGQSTFLVEMTETAKILHSCTSHSLVILDEVGRGTSTLDGLSIAWAVTEYLLDNERARPKTLFATHYHELTHLAERYNHMQNLHVEVKEWGDNILFLYKIRSGASDRSYGIHVARLAGLPDRVIDRAKEILIGLENDSATPRLGRTVATVEQTSLFNDSNHLREKLDSVDINNLTPVEALNFLSGLIKSKDV
jgi:DNA mismatch repair protein MutS